MKKVKIHIDKMESGKIDQYLRTTIEHLDIDDLVILNNLLYDAFLQSTELRYGYTMPKILWNNESNQNTLCLTKNVSKIEDLESNEYHKDDTYFYIGPDPISFSFYEEYSCPIDILIMIDLIKEAYKHDVLNDEIANKHMLLMKITAPFRLENEGDNA